MIRNVFVVLLMIACVGCVEEADKPAAKEGFFYVQPGETVKPQEGTSWRKFKEAGISLQIPKGWIVEEFKSPSGEIVKVSADSTYKVGLTVNVIKDVTSKTGISADLYALKLYKEYVSNVKSIVYNTLKKEDHFTKVKWKVIKDMPEHPGIEFTVRVSAIADRINDVLYIYIFGSPTETYDKNWKIGEKIFTPLLIHPEKI